MASIQTKMATNAHNESSSARPRWNFLSAEAEPYDVTNTTDTDNLRYGLFVLIFLHQKISSTRHAASGTIGWSRTQVKGDQR